METLLEKYNTVLLVCNSIPMEEKDSVDEESPIELGM